MNQDSETQQELSPRDNRQKQSRFAPGQRNPGEVNDRHNVTRSEDLIPDSVNYQIRMKFAYSMEIISGQFHNDEFINIKFDLILDGDWKLVSGAPTGITHCATPGNCKGQVAVFNFIERFTIASTNLQNFPQIILTVYGIDFLGRPVVKGYGVFILPCCESHKVQRVRLFRPVPSSWLVSIFGKINGKNPEYVNPIKTLINNHGRKFTTTEPIGYVDIKFSLHREGWNENGFSGTKAFIV